jgi:hypothetical protein
MMNIFIKMLERLIENTSEIRIEVRRLRLDKIEIRCHLSYLFNIFLIIFGTFLISRRQHVHD